MCVWWDRNGRFAWRPQQQQRGDSEAAKNSSYETSAVQAQVASVPKRLDALRTAGLARVKGWEGGVRGHDATLVKTPSIFHRSLPQRREEEMRWQAASRRGKEWENGKLASGLAASFCLLKW